MVFDDIETEKKQLAHIGYYRLQAYWYSFKCPKYPKKFIPGTKFNDALNIYQFDCFFRNHLLKAIEKIEVSFRSHIASCFSVKYDPHAYIIYSKGLFTSQSKHSVHLNKLSESIKNTDKIFIKHFAENYEENFPPLWAIMEIVSFGWLSKFFSNIRPIQLRKEISSLYDFSHIFLDGFLEHLTYIRNICAHHSRLWNIGLKKIMPLPKNQPANLKYYMTDKTKSIFNSLLIIDHILTIIEPNNTWLKTVDEKINELNIDSLLMGYPENWQLLYLK